VLLTEAPLNPRANRAKSAEIFFENFNVPSFYVQVQAILSLYASGRTTGDVLDSGDGVTTAVPVYEGFVLPHAVTRIDVGGREITTYLQRLLRKAGHVFHTSSELETVKNIKEKACFVALDIAKSEKDNADDVEPDVPYKLPDGKVIQIGVEKFRAPEVLFNPGLMGLEYDGVHRCLANSIAKCDLDIRRRMFSEIVLAGGSTLFEYFGERLLMEMRRLAPRGTRIKIWASSERLLSPWVGGSILSSLSTFKQMWITQKEWQEYGNQILYRKTF
jgi:centractin